MLIYEGKYSLTLKPLGHKYLVNGSEKPGVTSILGILNKPGLPQWAANQTVEYIKTHSEGLVDPEDTETVIVTSSTLRRARTASTRSRDDAADLGKYVHSWIEQYVKAKIRGSGWATNYKDEAKPAIQNFLSWEKEYKPIYLFSERTVYSEKFDYCGTVDCVCELEVEGIRYRVILDFKTGKPENQYIHKRGYTGKKRAYNTVFMQDAFYDIAIEEEDGVKAGAYAALYLSKDGGKFFGLSFKTDAFRLASKNLLKFYKVQQLIDYLNTWS